MNETKSANKIIWFLLATLVTILLSAAGGWAANQMVVDNQLGTKISTQEDRIDTIRENLAQQKQKLDDIDKKLDKILDKMVR